jgi:hypothetical protein
MPGMISRWIWDINNQIQLNDVLFRRMENCVWEEQSPNNLLRRLILLQPIITTANHDTIHPGVLYFNWEEPVTNLEINTDGTIEETESIYRRTSITPFWISINQKRIAFPNSSVPSSHAAKLLQYKFFRGEHGITPVHYHIEKIEDDWKRGNFSMWAYNFQDRQGSVTKGSHYGDDINANDPLYQETVGTPKNFVGIKLHFFDHEIKARINRKGVITLLGAQHVTGIDGELFNIIQSLSRYHI